MRDITAELLALQDCVYREFQCNLMPTVPKELVIGVRMPALRKLANSLSPEECSTFLSQLPHRYYEENNLHGILISGICDYNTAVSALNRFLPFVDNWATCDLIRPKAFQGRPEPLFDQICQWLQSPEPYTIRFAMEMLMVYYLEDGFSSNHLHLVASVRSEEYYVRMMQAWYFATALTLQYSAAIACLESPILEPWTHNKVIQKAIESYRIPDDRKSYLKTLRLKGIR